MLVMCWASNPERPHCSLDSTSMEALAEHPFAKERTASFDGHIE